MVEFSLIRLRRSFVFACTLLALLLAGGCQKKPQYNFRTATQSELDLKQSDTYPTVEDQARSPYIAFASTEFIGRLSRYHKTLSESFVLSALEEYSDLKVIEDQRVRGVLEFQEFQGFNRNSQQDLLRLGKRLQAEYVGLLRVTPSPVRASPNDWSTYIGLQVYRINPPKLMLRDEFTFVFSESAQQLRGLRTNIQKTLPMEGFILETYNDRAFAVVNLGRDRNITSGRRCKVYRRKRRERIETDGTKITETNYEEVGQLQIVEVLDFTSWAVVSPEFRGKILSGDLVTVQPGA